MGEEYVWVVSEGEYYQYDECMYCPDCDEYFPTDKLDVNEDGKSICPECGHDVE